MKTFAIFFLLLFGCANSERNSENQTLGLESFDAFYQKFFSDQVFQKNRIDFPLLNLLWDIDNKRFDKEIIRIEDWDFITLNDKKYIKKVIKSKSEGTLNIQIKDTGVSVNYIFILKNGRWYLNKIIDEST